MTRSVAAIVPAAGLSRRMGTCKQLLDLGGKTVIVRCLEALLAAGITEIVVVVGVAGEAVATAARRFPVRVEVNPDPDGDMASSVLIGFAALSRVVSGVLIAPGDCPLVLPVTIATLAAAHGANPDRIVVPIHQDRKGHPTLFPITILAELHHGGTLRDIMRRDLQRVHRLHISDPGILLDLDTPEDYQQLQWRLTSE